MTMAGAGAFAIAAGGATLLWARLPKSFKGFSKPPERDGGGSPPKELVVLVLATSLAMASGSALSAFLVSFAVATGIGAATAGLLLAAGGASAIAMRVMWGWLADRRSTRGYVGIVWLLTVGSVAIWLLTTEATDACPRRRMTSSGESRLVRAPSSRVLTGIRKIRSCHRGDPGWVLTSGEVSTATLRSSDRL